MSETLANDYISTSKEQFSSKSNQIPQPLTTLQPPENVFFVEVIKNGIVLVKQNITKSVITFGRSRDCDFPLDHPSISRYHCALLWKEDTFGKSDEGFFYLVDLDSTHGTLLNKDKLRSGTSVKLLPGNNTFRLGGSTRIFTLCSTIYETPEENDEIIETDKDKNYCNWGIDDDDDLNDDDNDEDNFLNPLATVMSLLQTDFSSVTTSNDNAFSSNPQKTLQQWFEREGHEYRYSIDSVNGKFKCTFELPVEGQIVPVEGSLFPKKKACLVDACLKTCKLLDTAKLLFPWQIQKNHQKRKGDDDDSDDNLLDETEERERKKLRMKAKQQKTSVQVDTFESLTEKWRKVSEDLKNVKVNLVSMSLPKKSCSSNEKASEQVEDPLDSFMHSMTSSSLDSKIRKSKLKMKIAELEKEQKRIEKLLSIAKPVTFNPSSSL